MKIEKSTRHSKIAGDFGESLVLYWLSKYGFECARVDHTGIDLIAFNRQTKELMGISVKSRTRTPGKEQDYVTLPKKHFGKIQKACKSFGCLPYFAIVVDDGKMVRVFITSVAHVLKLYPCKSTSSAWRMSPKCLERYNRDPKIMMFELQIKQGRWWRPSR